MKARTLVVAGLVGVAIAVAVFWPRPVTPEEAVRRAVVQMSRQAEDRDISGFMEHVSAKFAGPDGWGADDLKRVLAGLLLRDRWVRVFLVSESVSTNSDGTIACDAEVIFARSQAEKLKDLAANSIFGAYEIHGTFVHEDGEWRATSGSYRELDAKDLLSSESARFR
jgi:hypothetical protein